MSGVWSERLAAGGIVLIDGGTGTELRRRGVPVDGPAWSGPAAERHSALLEQIHVDFILAGADVITTNTFATTRFVLAAAGRGARFDAINERAVAAALRARERTGRDVAIAGAVSCLPPRFDTSAYPAAAAERAAYAELVETLVRRGVDLIALEMMQDTRHAALACAAAADAGLPTWLGVSCRRGVGGALVSYDLPSVGFAAVLDALLPFGPAVVNVMHTPPADVATALAAVTARWRGPIGAYPELLAPAGGEAAASLGPEGLASAAAEWIAAGARVIGGCCGATPAHIRALSQLRERHQL